MQNTFLSQLAGQIIALNLPLDRSAIVLPNRRARRMLMQAMAARLKAPFFAPAVFTINDFIERLSPLRILDKFPLVVRLYKSYKALAGADADEFGAALAWMPAFVDDMSEVDKQLCDGAGILRDLASAKDFEIGFGQDELSQEQQRKIKFYNLLAELYGCFQEDLRQEEYGYDGMVYRDCAENMEQYYGKLTYDHYVFAGFHVLNPAELTVVKYIKEHADAHFFFDIDPFYCDFQKNERFSTAHFLSKICRTLQLDERKLQFCSDSYATQQKNVRIVGTSKEMNQIYYAIHCLDEIEAAQGNLNDTALVLADESLLVPLLSAYDAANANVTMGYPLTATPVYTLLRSLFDIYERGQGYRHSGTMRFHRRDIVALLQSPLVRQYAFEDFESFGKCMNKVQSEQHFLYTLEELENVPLPAFGEVESVVPALLDFYRTMSSRAVANDDAAMLQLMVEQLAIVEQQIASLADAGVPPTLPIVKYAIRQQLENVRFSLKGDATQGLQIMGLLETRTLDFRNVIMLSVNEGTLPSGITYNSIIPYDFKFQNETLENYLYKDQVYAYHFFRLLQRAEKIVLLYNNNCIGGINEKSRFISQLEFEVRERHLDNIEIETPKVAFPYSPNAPERIEVAKSPEILKKLYDYSFSASALKTYITCPLQFYYKHLCGIEALDTVKDRVEANAVGAVVHAVFQHVFDVSDGPTGDFGKRIDAFLENVDSNIQKLILTDETLRQSVCWSEDDMKSGRIYLAMEMIRNDVVKYLQKSKHEFRESSVVIVGNETKLSCKLDVSGHNLTLFGIVDRLETEVDPETNKRHLTVVDYKTGKVNKDHLNVAVTESEQPFKDPQYKEFVQLFCYALLCKYGNNKVVKQYCGDQPTQCAILSIQDVNTGDDYLHRALIAESIEKRKKTGVSPWFTEERVQVFEEELKKLLSKIINPELKFSQTEDEKRCGLCDFKHLCGRT
ncbi:MAG: PD-(D/E)XK nuclease family protein [Bacteroidales bacterium]|nr:PD-(D/E)XK nuclease family protein [Bacteroidales bacterium]